MTDQNLQINPPADPRTFKFFILEREVGRLELKDGKVHLTGEMADVSKVLVDFVLNNSKEFIESERRKAVEQFKLKLLEKSQGFYDAQIEEVFTSLYPEK